MGEMSVWHWLVILIWAIVVQWPLWRIVQKAGYPGALSLLALLPLVNILALWAFALGKWPSRATTP